MKRLTVFLAAVGCLLAPQPAEAQRAIGMRSCIDLGVVIDAQGMDASRNFELDRPNGSPGAGLLVVWIELTDGNTSITRFDMSCTASHDGNTTDYTIQSCTVASGDCTSDDSTWRKASPGTANWPWRIDVEGYPDIQCAFSVGTGSGAAADLLTVRGRLCGK